MAIELRSKTARAVILPEHGGRLHQLYINIDRREESIFWSPDDPAEYDAHPTRGGCFPMAPWPNRIAGGRFEWRNGECAVPLDGKPDANHGRVANVPWRVVARTGRVVELAAEFDKSWPWAGKAWQRIEITDRALRLKMEVRSEREEFPAGCGWHPWFRRDAFGADPTAVAVTLNASEVYEAEIRVGAELLLARIDPDVDIRQGAAVRMRLDPRQCLLLSA